MAPQGLQAGLQRIEHRELVDHVVRLPADCYSGYIALAVSTDRGEYVKELDTGLGSDREKNMVAFAVEALKLVRDVIKGDAKL